MDDFESLVFSIWWIADIRSGRPNGLVLHENVKKGTAYDKMMVSRKYLLFIRSRIKSNIYFLNIEEM